jgi:WD40 repeat protein
VRSWNDLGGPIYQVLFPPEDGRLTTVGALGTRGDIRWWDVSQPLPIAVQSGEFAFTGAAINFDGSRLLAGDLRGRLRLFDASSGQLLGITTRNDLDPRDLLNQTPVRLALLDPEGNCVAVSMPQRRQVFIYHDYFDTNNRKATLEGETDGVLELAGGRSRLAVAGRDGVVKVWDAETYHKRATLKGHTGPVTAAAICAVGGRLFTGGDDGAVRVWDLETGVLLLTLEVPGSGTIRLATSDVDRLRAPPVAPAPGQDPVVEGPEAMRLVVGRGKEVYVWGPFAK